MQHRLSSQSEHQLIRDHISTAVGLCRPERAIFGVFGSLLRHDGCLGAPPFLRHDGCLGAPPFLRHDGCLGAPPFLRHDGCLGAPPFLSDPLDNCYE